MFISIATSYLFFEMGHNRAHYRTYKLVDIDATLVAYSDQLCKQELQIKEPDKISFLGNRSTTVFFFATVTKNAAKGVL